MSENFFESNSSESQITPSQVTNNYSVKSEAEEFSSKSRLAALLLGIFIGNLGIHNFYLGRIARGVVQCVLTVLGYVIYFGSIILIALKSVNYNTGDFTNLDSEAAILAAVTVPMIIFFIFVSISGIWSFVEWILIAAGVAKDKDGKIVKNW